MLSRAYLVSQALREAHGDGIDKLWADIAKLAEWGAEVTAQDNACTANPVFAVMQDRRIWNVTSDAATGHLWINSDTGEEVEDRCDDKLHEALELLSHDDPYEIEFVVGGETYVRAFFKDERAPVEGAFFLVRKHAERYIENNRHNLKAPSVFVQSAYRNSEWQLIRKLAVALAELESAAVALSELTTGSADSEASES